MRETSKNAAAGQPSFPAVPKLSVVMPVRNALPYLDEAIESILGQSFAEFEFVILDDASTDGSTGRLREWAARDDRIRLLEITTNLGPAVSSDVVARAASAPIVARMDADDICDRDRLNMQLDVLRRHPEAGLVASLFESIGATGDKVRRAEPWRIARKSVFKPFAHGSIMYRRSVFDRIGGYREECAYWEDLDFVSRLAAVSKIMVIPRPLYKHRVYLSPSDTAARQERLERAADLMFRSAARLARGQSYEDLLRSKDEGGKVDPRVFIVLGSVTLWAGGRPHQFRRLLRRGRLKVDFGTLVALVWTAWASASPSTQRHFLRLLHATMNRLAPASNADSPIVWAPSGSGTSKALDADAAGTFERASDEPQ